MSRFFFFQQFFLQPQECITKQYRREEEKGRKKKHIPVVQCPEAKATEQTTRQPVADSLSPQTTTPLGVVTIQGLKSQHPPSLCHPSQDPIPKSTPRPVNPRSPILHINLTTPLLPPPKTPPHPNHTKQQHSTLLPILSCFSSNSNRQNPDFSTDGSHKTPTLKITSFVSASNVPPDL